MNENLIAAINQTRANALIITHPPHITWATGLVSSNALLYADNTGLTVVTDGRYAEAASALHAKTIIANQENLAAALARALQPNQTIAYQPEYLSVDEFAHMQKELSGQKLVAAPGILRGLVATKNQAEVAAITKAQQITDEVFTEILEFIRPGVSEKEVAAELVYRQLKRGADGISPEFWPIVAFGANSALPHAQPTDNKLRENDVILLDFGCTVGGYCSDMTRTLVIGQAPAGFEQVYAVVLKAQLAALDKASRDVPMKEVDAAARSIIEAAGYILPHGTGHAVGLEIHEWPVLNPRHPEPLPPKCVITVEPGVYLPGRFGIRIEDMLYVGRDENRNLTRSRKDLIKL